MQLRSWLRIALRAIVQVKEDYFRRRAYVGRHWPVIPVVIPPWSEQEPGYNFADVRWGEALARFAARSRVSTVMS